MSEHEAIPKADGAESLSTAGLGARPINCDQVAWMLNAIGRYLPRPDHPAVSRAREMQKYALLYELMEVAYLHFEDAAAKHNGTPPDVMRFQCASKQAEHEAQQGNICKAPNVEHNRRTAASSPGVRVDGSVGGCEP